MYESRNNHEARIFYFYIFITITYNWFKFIIITLWKPKELDKNGIRAESRLDLSGDIVKEWSLLFCGRDQQLDITGLLNLPLIYHMTDEVGGGFVIAFSCILILDC